MRNRSWCRGAIVVTAFLALSAAAAAQKPWECPTTVPTTCPDVEDNKELREIPELVAKLGEKELSTTFDVQMKTFCVSTGKEVKEKARTERDETVTKTYKAEPMQLRTYVYTDPETGKTFCGFPGPTLRVHKPVKDERGQGLEGQGLAILLKNSLPASNEACENACPSSVQCAADQCDSAKLADLVKACSSATPPNPPNNCCCVINCTQEAPNCFHGDNTTNLHFHGTHASPQEPQDFVLLELRPGKPPTGGSACEHGHHGPYSKVCYGQFQYRVDPFGDTQSAGTHWYHPHKHGSVGLQVANGMAGALIIEGQLDKWMNEILPDPNYGPRFDERLMVIQQIALGTNLFQQGIPRPILVNGQPSPKITVTPGRIQRWRIVNATMSSQAMLQIKFDPRLVLKQIAMDGIFFSETNFECQPLANFDPKSPSFLPCPKTSESNRFKTITLAPGNRVDFLVLFPLQETTKDHPPLRIERQMVDIHGEESSQRMLLRQQDEELAPGLPEPALFQVIVDDGIEGNDDQPKLLAATAPTLPSRLPGLPDEVKSVRKEEAIDPNQITMTFQQLQAVTGQPWPFTASPLSQFMIDEKQFNPDCANVTTRVNTSRTWKVSNATQLPHPFHIHTNPFALLDYAGATLQPGGRPEPIWMDTMPLPLASLTVCPDPNQCPNAVACTLNPKDPNYGKTCSLKPSAMTFVQRYEQFTGEYVLHCHFLGHEDRGMMFAVQTVCEDKPDYFGKAGVPKPECQGELLKGELLKAVDSCK